MNNKSLQVRDLLFYYQNSGANISFIVSAKKGNAVLRNKFKRRCRGIFNLYQKKLNQNYSLIIKPQKALKENYSWQELNRAFDRFFSKLDV